MSKIKTTCLDIEIAIMRKYNIRTHLIVPNVSNQMNLVPFETDMLVINKNGFATGFEIKTSKSDLKADFKKPQHTKINDFYNGKGGFKRWWGKFKYFNYAVPIELVQDAFDLIPDFCGLYVYESLEYPLFDTFSQVKKPKKISDYKWDDKKKFQIARLGTLRLLGLKQTIQSYINK